MEQPWAKVSKISVQPILYKEYKQVDQSMNKI